MSTSPWEWWVGYAEEVENTGAYSIGSYATRDEAIEAGRREADGAFYIIEAQLDPRGAPEVDAIVRFVKQRNAEKIYGKASK